MLIEKILYTYIKGILLFLLFASKMSKFLGNKFRKCYFRIWNFLKNFFIKKFQIIKTTFLRKKITNENMTESYKKQMVPLTIVLCNYFLNLKAFILKFMI